MFLPSYSFILLLVFHGFCAPAEGVDHKWPDPEVMLSSRLHSGFSLDANQLQRFTYSGEDRPLSAARRSAFSSKSGPS